MEEGYCLHPVRRALESLGKQGEEQRKRGVSSVSPCMLLLTQESTLETDTEHGQLQPEFNKEISQIPSWVGYV